MPPYSTPQACAWWLLDTCACACACACQMPDEQVAYSLTPCLLAYLLTCLLAYLLTCLLAYLLTCLLTYLLFRCQTSKLRDFECFHLPHRIGFERGFDKLLVSYSLHALADCPYSPPPSLCSLASPTHRNPEVESLAISPEAAEETFRFLQHAAKTAVWSRACSPVRCWTKCCALCAARTWCVAWEWDLETEICSLSDQTPLEDAYPSAYPSVNGRGAAPGNLTFRRVVGAVQPMVERPAWVPASTSRGLPLQRDSARETRLRRRAARQAQGPRAAYAGPPRGDRCSASSGDRVVNE